MRFDWHRTGGYEVSSKGDKRFSAFNAIMPDGRSIEHHYQCDVKGYDPGGTQWQLGKGKPPLKAMTPDQLWQAYLELWRIWAEQHQDLIQELRHLAVHGEGALVLGGVCYLSDAFAGTSINQARALSVILSEREAQ